MISALSQSRRRILVSPRYLEAASRAANFLRSDLTRQGGLLRSWRGQAGNVAGFAEDYAFLIQGLLDLYEADWEVAWLQWALKLQERQDALFLGRDARSLFQQPSW